MEPLPARWREIFGEELRFRLDWYDQRGRPRSTTLSHIDSVPSITVALLSQTPLYLTPLTPGGEELQPAGALYPLSLDRNDHLSLSWRVGCLSRFLHRHFPSARWYYNFNAQRLQREVHTRSAGRNCWVNYPTIAARMQIGAMRADAIKVHPLYRHTVTLEAGEWRAVDLHTASRIVHRGGALVLPELPAGIHLWYRIESGIQATIQIEEQRAVVLRSVRVTAP